MLIVGNWKAYIDSATKAKKLFAVAKRLAASRKNVEIVLAAPTPYLGLLAVGNRSNVRFAGQDISVDSGGAATGEVTGSMLADIGVSYVLVGHSERRARGESDATVAEKMQQVFAHGLTPILCIGERERDADAQYLTFVRTQIASALAPLTQKQRLEVVIAYEPVWAIGKTAAEAITPDELVEMVLYIRKVLAEFVPGKGNQTIRIIYGGSAEPGNVRELAATSGVEGFLPGHASADAATFAALVKALP